MACCVQKIDLCIAQASDKQFVFTDSDDVDYGLVSDIRFGVWENSTTGAELISKTLIGGDIALINNHSFSLSIDNTESAALTKGTKYCEVWVIQTGGDRNIVGAGPFSVIDTREFD